ncbi:MAG TPA: nucleoside monophosphate kinase [Candidatus Babeliales bacterium]|nr:nucleoside monophosphate kinase [Candidatus Babeliales bacterium]
MNGKKDIFVFIGPPGSGKGSLSALCVKELQWLQLSTGNLCRQHIANQTEIGKIIEAAIKSGGLVSDDIIIAMVEEWLLDTRDDIRTVILDGYPRSVHQAESFCSLIKNQFKNVSFHVVLFTLSDEKLIARLTSRLICQKKECQAVYSTVEGSGLEPQVPFICDVCSGPLERRKDDDIEAILVRLDMYHKHTQPLMDFYKKIGQPVIEIDVDSSLEDIFQEFKRKVL